MERDNVIERESEIDWRGEKEFVLVDKELIMRVQTAQLIDFGFSGFKPGSLNSTWVTLTQSCIATKAASPLIYLPLRLMTTQPIPNTLFQTCFVNCICAENGHPIHSLFLLFLLYSGIHFNGPG